MICYLIVGISFVLKGDYPWSLVWFSYSTANLGLILAQTIR